MVLTDEEISLIESSKVNLKAFLSEFGEFYPFAMIMDNDGIIYPLEREIIEEYPDVDSVIDLLERTFENEIVKTGNEYKLGIFCINVSINSPENETVTKRDAIEIRLIGTTYRKKLLLYYEITETNEVILQELVGWF